MNWPDAQRAVAELDWGGKILVDATNAHIDSPPDISLEGVTRSRAALNGRTSSELLAEWVPGARLVKAISNVPMEWISAVSNAKPRTVLFASGDDEGAKKVVIDLLNHVGFAAIDLGPLGRGALHEVGAPLSGLEFHFVRRMR